MNFSCLIKPITNWMDWYGGSMNIVKGIYSNKTFSTFTTNENYIYDCMFENTNNVGNGGGISWTKENEADSNMKLLVEDTAFIKCRCTLKGGGIYFFSQGECVLSRLCCFRCQSTEYYDAFDHVFVSDDPSKRNILSQFSASDVTTSSRTITSHSHGTIKMSELNHSFTICQSINIYIAPSTNTDPSFVNELKFTLVKNNTAREDICLEYNHAECICSINYCNIIKNDQWSETRGLLHILAKNLNINNTCILENNAHKCLFQFGDAHITTHLSNCVLDFGEEKMQGNYVFDSQPEQSYLNHLMFIETAACRSSYDQIGNLTQIIVIPPRTRDVHRCITSFHSYGGGICALTFLTLFIFC